MRRITTLLGVLALDSAHGSRGCSQPALQSSGGDGLFYCFAVGGS